MITIIIFVHAEYITIYTHHHTFQLTQAPSTIITRFFITYNSSQQVGQGCPILKCSIGAMVPLLRASLWYRSISIS